MIIKHTAMYSYWVTFYLPIMSNRFIGRKKRTYLMWMLAKIGFIFTSSLSQSHKELVCQNRPMNIRVIKVWTPWSYWEHTKMESLYHVISPHHLLTMVTTSNKYDEYTLIKYLTGKMFCCNCCTGVRIETFPKGQPYNNLYLNKNIEKSS